MAHAYENVAFYRELFDRRGVRPGQIRGVADIGRIPVVTKQDLRAAPVPSTVARGYDPARLLTAKTSGASGEPFEMRRTWLEQRLSHLFRLRAERQFGKRSGDRHAWLALENAPQAAHHKMLGKALQRLGFEHRLMLEVRDPAEVHLRRLRAFRPDILSGYPNALCHCPSSAIGWVISSRVVPIPAAALSRSAKSALSRAG